jgi:hypothetical protein
MRGKAIKQMTIGAIAALVVMLVVIILAATIAGPAKARPIGPLWDLPFHGATSLVDELHER